MTAWSTDHLQRGEIETVETAMVGSFQVRLIALHSQLIARHTRIATGAPPEPDPDALPNTWAADGSAGSSLPPARMLPSSRINPWHVVRNQLDFGSPWFRNSLRTALALAIAVGVVNANSVDHGFWVVLGTMTALRFDALGTGRTAMSAIVGTGAGFLVGTLVLIAVGDHTNVYWVLLPIAAFLSGYTPGAISLMVGQASFTVFVIVFYGILQGPDVRTGETRVIDVAIGLSISLLVSALMWPRGVMARVSVTLGRSVEEATAFLVAAYDRLLQGPLAQDRVVAARAAAMQSLDVADETFDLAMSQSGAAPLYTQAWSATANAAGEIVACADLVRLLAVNGHQPAGCPAVGDLMISSAHYVQTQMNAAVSHATYLQTVAPTEYADADLPQTLVDTSPFGNPLPRLQQAVTDCLTSWNGQSPIPDRSSGDLATSTIWAQDWLVYMSWLAQRIARITNAPKDKVASTEQDSTTAPSS